MKLNRKIWLIVFSGLVLIPVSGQYEEQDSLVYSDSAAPVFNPEYDPVYHFDDSAQSSYNRSESKPEFNREYWKKLVKDKTFEEESGKEPKKDSIRFKREIKSTGSGSISPVMKYISITLAIAILLFLMYKFLPAFRKGNIKNKQDLVISLDELDEEEIRSIELETPLSQALREGDYRKAYRLRYLSVLKQLISRNLILYRKEKTNYEYLLQLTGRAIYEPFRLLTFNFDGIWYGELAIDKARYDELDRHFVNFNSLIEQ